MRRQSQHPGCLHGDRVNRISYREDATAGPNQASDAALEAAAFDCAYCDEDPDDVPDRRVWPFVLSMVKLSGVQAGPAHPVHLADIQFDGA